MSDSTTFLPRINAPLPNGTEKLFSAVLSDALDAVGWRDQTMSPRMRPLDETLKMCGRARTGRYVEVTHVDEDANPYELEMAIVDDLKPGDVAVFSCGGSLRIAPWGGLLSTATNARGGAGCVTDGFVRDVLDIKALKLPVFSIGIAPLDSKGRGQVQAVDVPVICDSVLVQSGDLVFGDVDGVVVVPQVIEEEVLRYAFDKINGEHNSMAELRAGAYLRDVYAKYKIL